MGIGTSRLIKIAFLAVALVGATAALLSVESVPADHKPKAVLTSAEDDFVQIDYLKLREMPPRVVVVIEKNGKAQSLGIDGNTIVQHSSGSISAQQAEQIFQSLRAKRFTAIKDMSPPTNIAYEGDALVVMGRIDGEIHRTSSRPPEYVSSTLLNITQSVQESARQLAQSVTPSWFVQALEVDQARADLIRREGELTFLRMTREELGRRPLYGRAIGELGRFIEVPDEQKAELRDSLKQFDSFFISSEDATYEMNVFRYQKR